MERTVLRPLVLITPEGLIGDRGPWVEKLESAGFDVAYPEDPTFTRGHAGEDETVKVLGGACAVLAGGEHLSGAVIGRLPDLRVIARVGVGYDRVDVPAATERRVAVTITPTSNHEAVAEQAFALLFAVAKSVVENHNDVAAGRWPRNLTEPVRGKTFGVFGLGRIGRSAALRGLGMRMRVIACETYPDQEFAERHGIELVDFNTLLAQSDYLSIHCPLMPETEGLFNQEVFAKMKPGSVLINTARGPIVKEQDLARAIQNGPLRGAGLDVFEQEPTSPDNPLFGLPNVVLAPHLGGLDWLSQQDMAIESADSIIKLRDGVWPEGAVVNDELRESWNW